MVELSFNHLFVLSKYKPIIHSYVLLPGGGELVDTVGINEFGLVNFSVEDLAESFPGFEQAMENSCHFGNCRDRTQPCCAVSEGGISEERYNSYLAILDPQEAGDSRFRNRR